MIDSDYARLMARYNQWQNQSLFRAAATLSDADRKADRGAFFESIHGTLSHLLWADRVWMSRFDGWARPDTPQAGSGRMIEHFDRLGRERGEDDARIIAWADAVPEGNLGGPLSFYSGALGSEVTLPLWMCITHFFNHQTHHRGQAHALLTAAGAVPEDTDLFLMPEAQSAPA